MSENAQKEKNKDNTNGMLKKIFNFLKGMPFSFILLGIISFACIVGSVIPQGQSIAYYMENFGARKGNLIIAFSFDDIFRCWWFIALAGLLCFNLILCSISRIKSVSAAWKRTKRIGIWGSWLTHLGLLLLIISFALSQYTSYEEEIYGIPGSSQPLGNTGLQIAIDSFDVRLRDDYTVEQYVAGLTVSNEKGEKQRGEASVNYPFKAFGYSFYQNSMGWANYVDIYKDGELVRTDLLCAGEYTYPDDFPALVIMFNKFYPDFAEKADGSFYTVTPLLKNPRSLYGIFYNGNLMSMDIVKPGELITVHNYGFVLRDPVQYTLIVGKTDPYAWTVLVAASVLIAGLVLSFYIRPWEENRRKDNGEN